MTVQTPKYDDRMHIVFNDNNYLLSGIINVRKQQRFLGIVFNMLCEINMNFRIINVKIVFKIYLLLLNNYCLLHLTRNQ